MANTQINLNGYQMKIKDNGDGTYSTTTCSTTQEIQLLSALAVTDTVGHYSSIFDISNLSGRKYIHVASTLNQAATVSVLVYNSAGSGNVTIGSKSIAANTNGIITASDIANLSEPYSKMAVCVTCAVAPASGNINIWLEGVSS